MRGVMLKALIGASIFCMASQAQAAVAVCSVNDITPAAQACTGFFEGNLINDAHIAEQTAALASLGLVWDGTIIQKLEGLAGNHTIDFSALLTGISYIGLHFGNGTGGPGNGTAFYRIDAGAGLDTFLLNYNASSDAALYSTVPGVPEPGTWAMMLLGFGAAGFVLRRRKRPAMGSLQIA